jgi:hypothetical protein
LFLYTKLEKYKKNNEVYPILSVKPNPNYATIKKEIDSSSFLDISWIFLKNRLKIKTFSNEFVLTIEINDETLRKKLLSSSFWLINFLGAKERFIILVNKSSGFIKKRKAEQW